MNGAALSAGAALLVFMATPASADVGNFRCTFNSDPAVTLDVRVVNDTRVEIAYPNGERIPYDATGTNNVQTWRSNHRPPVRYEFDSSRRLAWALVPLNNPAALSADEAFDPRIHRRAVVRGANPAPKLDATRGYSAACDVLP